MSAVNPIQLQIARNRWCGIAEEACAAMIRASFSPNIRDRRDCSTALATPDGQIVAQAEVGTPLHLGIMPAVISAVLKQFPLVKLLPGDGVLTNLPYPEGPGHLPDVSLVSAVHHEGEPVALVATTAHHVDMGGYAPGSMPFGVTEIFQEGLQIPPLKMFQRGKLNDALYSLINQNVRTQREVHGDLMAQWAAASTAQRRVQELFARDGSPETHRLMEAVLDHAERSMRAGLRQIPDGTYEYEDFLDDDGVTDDPVRIKVAVTVRGDELLVDFAGSSDQVAGPLNARLSAARACVYYVAKAVIDPDLPSSAGAHRPITVRAPEGSVLQARYPAAIGNANILTDQRVVDALLGAFHQAVPERVCAACSGEMNLVNLGGIDPGTGAYFNWVETIGGGQGAMHDRDGDDGIHTHLTNTLNTPIEVLESHYPLRVTEYGLIPDSAGRGRHRGGTGICREIQFLGQRATLTIGADRRKFRPWGLEGGEAARGAHSTLTHADGSTETLATKVITQLRHGDVLRIQTPGGGGYGDPNRRAPEANDRDIADGLVRGDEPLSGGARDP